MTISGVPVKYISLLIGIIFSISAWAETLEEGYEAVRSGKLDEGYAILSELAATGDADAQYGVAILYKEGWGTDKDIKTAFDYYQKAARQNHPGALFGTRKPPTKGIPSQCTHWAACTITVLARQKVKTRVWSGSKNQPIKAIHQRWNSSMNHCARLR